MSASATEAEREPAAKDIATLIVGKAPTLPDAFMGLELGMTGDAAKKVLSTLPEDTIFESPGYEGMFSVHFDYDSGKLAGASFSLPKDSARSLIESAWGEPIEVEDIGRKKLYWFNPEAGVRAALSEGFGDDMSVELSQYEPFVAFLGAEGPTFAFETAPILGATIEELRAGYPEVIVESSQEEADEDRARLEEMVGGDKAKVAVLGPARPSVHLSFMPTEWQSFRTRIHPYFARAGTVQSYSFDVAYELHPDDKQVIFDLLETKFGEPKAIKDMGRDAFEFQEKPRVLVRDDTISGSWTIEVGR